MKAVASVLISLDGVVQAPLFTSDASDPRVQMVARSLRSGCRLISTRRVIMSGHELP